MAIAKSTPRFSHIDATDPHDVYAIDTDGRAYSILWRDEDAITELDARAIGALPITERFLGQDASIPIDYLDAWTGTAEA